MDEDVAATGIVVVGIFIGVFAVVTASHWAESTCQIENDVADCVWISVPTDSEEGVNASVILQK